MSQQRDWQEKILLRIEMMPGWAGWVAAPVAFLAVMLFVAAIVYAVQTLSPPQ